MIHFEASMGGQTIARLDKIDYANKELRHQLQSEGYIVLKNKISINNLINNEK